MDKSDIEKEDTENHHRDSGSYVKESENNSKEEKSTHATAIAEDAEESEKGEEAPCESEVINTARSRMGIQINPKNEVHEPMNAEGSFDGQMKNERKNDLGSNVQESENKQDGGEENNISRDFSKDNKIVSSLMEGQTSPNSEATDNVNAVNNCGEDRELMGKSLAIAVEPKAAEIVVAGNNSSENKQLPTKPSSSEDLLSRRFNEDEEMEDVANVNEGEEVKDELKEQSKEAAFNDGNTVETIFTQAMLPPMAEDDDGTPDEQATFMKELESFHRERAMDFNPLEVNGEPLNFLKLWRCVIRLGGYDRVTGYKLWRQVGESFHPPKSCTTIYWALQSFYEKYVLEYERHKTQSGKLQLPEVQPPEPEASGVDSEGNGYQGSGSERDRRDNASRSIQGSHAHHSGHGEAGEPVMKGKNPGNMAICEKNIKNIGSIKRKKPNDAEINTSRTETSKQPLTPVVDVGPSADWVKISVRETRDCFEVYGLVPGLLSEEVRVQSDPAGRLVIMGQPQQVGDPWGVAPFQKIISFPVRINPRRTSAFISMHGRLFVRVPFEQSKKCS
ncbi:AT-rich interactive domain-containing protein 5-like isoform X1 [Primulina eburnea]|uniref:AT-rich interactive domain-containing protein 5-like isoform X1 n=2 Tax=Primulina eburnea TaxID=1245227 RepID=UPI003C6C5403